MIDKLTSIGRLGAEFTVTDGIIGVASATASLKNIRDHFVLTSVD